MATLTAQQKQIAIDVIIHMEGTDGSSDLYSPTKLGWGGKGSAISYGYVQNNISRGVNEYDTISSSQAVPNKLEHYASDPALKEIIVDLALKPAGAAERFAW